MTAEASGCPLGCRAGDTAVYTGRDRLHGLPGEFTVVRCVGCGLMRTEPRPTASAMAAFYPAGYAPHRPLRERERRRAAERPGPLKRIARRVFAFETAELPALPPGRMLEIGCGAGRFLLRMASRGWDVEGIETSAAGCRAARALGFRVIEGGVEDVADPDRAFDLVVGWMVLEHLRDPLAALRRIRGWTRAGGWLVLSVPNCASWDARFFRGAWYGAELPRHLFHFTEESLGLVLGRAGWHVERVFHHRTLPDPIGSVGLALQGRRGVGRLSRRLVATPARMGLLNYLLYPLAALLAAAGQTGRMTVWARRADSPDGR